MNGADCSRRSASVGIGFHQLSDTSDQGDRLVSGTCCALSRRHPTHLERPLHPFDISKGVQTVDGIVVVLRHIRYARFQRLPLPT